MLLRFNHQILIGNRVHGVGEVIEFPDRAAVDLVRRGVAVEHARDDPIREQTAEPVQARRAVRR